MRVYQILNERCYQCGDVHGTTPCRHDKKTETNYVPIENGRMFYAPSQPLARQLNRKERRLQKALARKLSKIK